MTEGMASWCCFCLNIFLLESRPGLVVLANIWGEPEWASYYPYRKNVVRLTMSILSLEPRLSVPIFLQSCETKSGTESLGSRLVHPKSMSKVLSNKLFQSQSPAYQNWSNLHGGFPMSCVRWIVHERARETSANSFYCSMSCEFNSRCIRLVCDSAHIHLISFMWQAFPCRWSTVFYHFSINPLLLRTKPKDGREMLVV